MLQVCLACCRAIVYMLQLKSKIQFVFCLRRRDAGSREAACRGSGDGCANLAHTLLSCNLVDEAREMATRGVQLGRFERRFCCLLFMIDTCCSVSAILVAARAMLHPDHVTQRSCASVVSMLFAALDRPLDRDMALQVAAAASSSFPLSPSHFYISDCRGVLRCCCHILQPIAGCSCGCPACPAFGRVARESRSWIRGRALGCAGVSCSAVG